MPTKIDLTKLENNSANNSVKTNWLNRLNTEWIRTYSGSLIGLLLATVLLIVTICFELDLFEKSILILQHFEYYELDELVIPVILFSSFAIVNLTQLARKRHIEGERVEVYKNMVIASNHVLKTCLNQMMVIRLAAEETPGFDNEVLGMFDQIVSTAKTQLDALGKLKDPTVEVIWATIYAHSMEGNTFT